MSLAHYRVSASQSVWHAFRGQGTINKGRLMVLRAGGYRKKVRHLGGFCHEPLPVRNVIAALERQVVLGVCVSNAESVNF